MTEFSSLHISFIESPKIKLRINSREEVNNLIFWWREDKKKTFNNQAHWKQRKRTNAENTPSVIKNKLYYISFV